MYNYLKGGEQYKYATRPIIVTIPDDDPHYVDHCTDYHYISETKLKFSKKMYELFGIHLDWHTYQTRAKGEECWFRGMVHYWKAGENLDKAPFHTLYMFRQLSAYLRKKVTITVVSEDTLEDSLRINGDL